MIDPTELKAAIDDWNDTAENGTMPPDRRATLRLVAAAARKTLLPEWVEMENAVREYSRGSSALSAIHAVIALGRALAKTEGEG